VLSPSRLVAVALLSSKRARESAFGLVTRAGLLSLTIAWLHRRGPAPFAGRMNHGGSGCDQYLNRWRWLAVGVVLVVTGIVAHARPAD
jgi:hypothetical protein